MLIFNFRVTLGDDSSYAVSYLFVMVTDISTSTMADIQTMKLSAFTHTR